MLTKVRVLQSRNTQLVVSSEEDCLSAAGLQCPWLQSACRTSEGVQPPALGRSQQAQAETVDHNRASLPNPSKAASTASCGAVPILAGQLLFANILQQNS